MIFNQENMIDTKPPGRYSPRRSIDLLSEAVPTLADIIDGILAHQLSLHYARWVYYHAVNSKHPPGPFLELAYWIGRGPGQNVSRDDSLFEMYRDSNSGLKRDKWVVFHIHFNPETNFLRAFNDQIYMGASYVSVFHAHDYETWLGDIDWRVDGRASDDANIRNGIYCSVHWQDRLWYIGRRDPAPKAEGARLEWLRKIEEWGEMLFAAGYVGRPGRELLYPETRIVPTRGHVDPGEPRHASDLVCQLRDEEGYMGRVYSSNWVVEQGVVRRLGQGPPVLTLLLDGP